MRDAAEFILCYVTDRLGLAAAHASEQALLEVIARAAEAGVDWIQIREKDLLGGPLYALVCAAIGRARPAQVLVNDRLDVAWAAGAAGVHLGSRSLPAGAVRDLRERLGAGFRIGVSCHAVEEVRRAERDGADYVFFGPVFATPAKMVFGPPLGVERLREAVEAVRIPVLAIGGIDEENAARCYQAGAAGIAAIRFFQRPGDLRGRLRQLRARLRVASADSSDAE